MVRAKDKATVTLRIRGITTGGDTSSGGRSAETRRREFTLLEIGRTACHGGGEDRVSGTQNTILNYDNDARAVFTCSTDVIG